MLEYDTGRQSRYDQRTLSSAPGRIKAPRLVRPHDGWTGRPAASLKAPPPASISPAWHARANYTPCMEMTRETNHI